MVFTLDLKSLETARLGFVLNIFLAHNKVLFSSILPESAFFTSLNLIPNSFSKSAIPATSSFWSTVNERPFAPALAVLPLL